MGITLNDLTISMPVAKAEKGDVYYDSASSSAKGDQPKWFEDNVYYKADMRGYESLSECVISNIIPDVLKYTLRLLLVHHEYIGDYPGVDISYLGCSSVNFLDTNDILIPLERLHRAFTKKSLAQTLASVPNVKDRIKYTVDFVTEVTELTTFSTYLTKMLEIDALFLNEDRHTNNIVVIYNTQTCKYRLAPIFDNGAALLSDIRDYPLDVDVYQSIQKVKAKPFSRSFDDQLDACEELYGQKLKLSVKKQDLPHIFYASALGCPIEFLLRAYDILCYQFDKYSYFFNTSK